VQTKALLSQGNTSALAKQEYILSEASTQIEDLLIPIMPGVKIQACHPPALDVTQPWNIYQKSPVKTPYQSQSHSGTQKKSCSVITISDHSKSP
jgi:hypothetical protein